MSSKRLRAFVPIVVFVVAGMTLAACDSGESGGCSEEDVCIGFSWNNQNEERWAKFDETAFVNAVEEGGGKYLKTLANSSAEQQNADVENLISQNADVLVILAQDNVTILPAVQSALDQGIPVIAYDRLIENPDVLYATFDNVEVGRLQAQAIYDAVPTGNYVFIKGNPADANADFVHSGQLEVLQSAIDSGDIVNVGESYTDNWAPENAQTEMEQFLTANNNDVQAVVSSNDGMAGGVVAALEAQGLAGEVPVSGQDGDAAALNRVALGTQTVSVWKDGRDLGQAAGEAAIALASGTALTSLPGTTTFDFTNKETGQETNFKAAILLTPVAITQDNLNLVVDAGWITTDALCQDVPAGTVSVCG
jgi:D-xylose transport system substrate-binding protein